MAWSIQTSVISIANLQDILSFTATHEVMCIIKDSVRQYQNIPSELLSPLASKICLSYRLVHWPSCSGGMESITHSPVEDAVVWVNAPAPHSKHTSFAVWGGGGYANNARGMGGYSMRKWNEHTINITPYVVEAWYNVNIKLKEYSCGQKFT